MSKQVGRWMKRFFVCASVLLVMLMALHYFYTLPYVAKILIYGNDGFPDDYDIPVADIAASPRPHPLPRSLDSRVVDILPQFDGIDDAKQFLDTSDTTGLVVVAGGEVISEQYRRGRSAQTLERTYSVSKAVLSALIGVALQDGLIQIDAPVTRYVPELAARDENFSQILVGDLLNMRSGIAYTSGITFPFLNADDALLYYYHDFESIIIEHMTIAEPPGAFDYHQYNTALLGLILRRVTGTTVADYLQSKLWTPLGAEFPAQWVTDAQGFEAMASGLHATPMDLAKLGLLYLRGGQKDGHSLIPASWTALSDADSATLEQDTGSRPYRHGWWLVPQPTGAWDFSATGSYGQYVYISPESDVVIVRTGVSRGDWDDDQWIALFSFIAARLR
ncbi:MAG: serine hydrolase domain-containing protein [Gammaproteobacteria bacterium]